MFYGQDALCTFATQSYLRESTVHTGHVYSAVELQRYSVVVLMVLWSYIPLRVREFLQNVVSTFAFVFRICCL